MSLELSRLYQLMSGPETASVEVGRMPTDVAMHFGCGLGIVYLSHPSLHHIVMEKAHASLEDLLMLPTMLDNGLWMADGPNTACIMYQPEGSYQRFASALKVAANGFEPYLTSFYRARQRQTAAKLRRPGTIILQKHR